MGFYVIIIYLIITTSIINKVGITNNEHRKNRYIECIQSALNLIKDKNIIKPIIVENNGIRDTFLDTFDCDIVYTDNNKNHFYIRALMNY